MEKFMVRCISNGDTVLLAVRAESKEKAAEHVLQNYNVDEVLEVFERPKAIDTPFFREKQLGFVKRAYKKVTLFG